MRCISLTHAARQMRVTAPSWRSPLANLTRISPLSSRMAYASPGSYQVDGFLGVRRSTHGKRLETPTFILSNIDWQAATHPPYQPHPLRPPFIPSPAVLVLVDSALKMAKAPSQRSSLLKPLGLTGSCKHRSAPGEVVMAGVHSCLFDRESTAHQATRIHSHPWTSQHCNGLNA